MTRAVYVPSGENRWLLARMSNPGYGCRAHDEYIGWSAQQKQQRLHLTTNNTGFPILPWVRVPIWRVGSWGDALRRLARDWDAKYGHPLVLVEIFVERDWFRGTCYKAANWIHSGTTTGRSRQDRHHTLRVPFKDVYLYPLGRRFCRELAG